MARNEREAVFVQAPLPSSEGSEQEKMLATLLVLLPKISTKTKCT